MEINKLGDELISCSLNCEGIKNNPKDGTIPRSLILEPRSGKNSCVVVGLNPGKCKEEEKNYYLKNGIKYESLSKYFSESLYNKKYFRKTRKLISLLGFDGNILWTNLAKCECLGENGKIPIQTLRTCINRFLKVEIKTFNYPTIFALGNIAFNFCALSFPKHFIVGLPHPSGSHGDFDKLKRKIDENKQFFIQQLMNQKDKNGYFVAIHLSKINQ